MSMHVYSAGHQIIYKIPFYSPGCWKDCWRSKAKSDNKNFRSGEEPFSLYVFICCFLFPDYKFKMGRLFFVGFILQGGNNIHGEGISKLAEALKDNDAITTVSHLAFENV